MSVELAPDLIETKQPSVSLPFPASLWGRVVYGLFVTFLPAFSFWATNFVRPEWQNGRSSSYIILLLTPEASLWFLPLLTYAIICYLLLMLEPARFAPMFFIRAGIYTGIVLALHYSIMVLLYSLDGYLYAVALVWISPIVFSLAYRWAVSKWTVAKVNNILFILIPIALLVAILIVRGAIHLILLIALTMAAPFWSFLLALRAGVWLYKNYETRLTLPRGFGFGAWLAAYIAAWRYDILKMYELYAQLPTAPPDCYIATAAARGHPRIVRSRQVKLANGIATQVNGQLQILKCAELALMAVAPHWHKHLRKVYDRVGNQLARKIQNRFLADMAYLSLKPFEWLAEMVLKLIIPEIDSIAVKMYAK